MPCAIPKRLASHRFCPAIPTQCAVSWQPQEQKQDVTADKATAASPDSPAPTDLNVQRVGPRGSPACLLIQLQCVSNPPKTQSRCKPSLPPPPKAPMQHYPVPSIHTPRRIPSASGRRLVAAEPSILPQQRSTLNGSPISPATPTPNQTLPRSSLASRPRPRVAAALPARRRRSVMQCMSSKEVARGLSGVAYSYLYLCTLFFGVSSAGAGVRRPPRPGGGV